MRLAHKSQKNKRKGITTSADLLIPMVCLFASRMGKKCDKLINDHNIMWIYSMPRCPLGAGKNAWRRDWRGCCSFSSSSSSTFHLLRFERAERSVRSQKYSVNLGWQTDRPTDQRTSRDARMRLIKHFISKRTFIITFFNKSLYSIEWMIVVDLMK